MSCSVCPCAPLSPRAAANEHQVAALQSYVACFRDGTLASHVQGSRHWVQDKGPTVESYIGFIESYQLRRAYWSRRLYFKLAGSFFVMHRACCDEMVSSTTEGFECAPSRESLVVWTSCCVCAAPYTVRRDPFGVRGEWEGFVACVNAAQTIKFSTLVAEAEKVRPCTQPHFLAPLHLVLCVSRVVGPVHVVPDARHLFLFGSTDNAVCVFLSLVDRFHVSLSLVYHFLCAVGPCRSFLCCPGEQPLRRTCSSAPPSCPWRWSPSRPPASPLASTCASMVLSSRACHPYAQTKRLGLFCMNTGNLPWWREGGGQLLFPLV
jgi:hypothetical protein